MLLVDLVQTSFGDVSLMEKGYAVPLINFLDIFLNILLVQSFCKQVLAFVCICTQSTWMCCMSRCFTLSQAMLCVLEWRVSSRKVIKASQVDILLVSRSITLRAMIFKLWNLPPILFVPSHMLLRMVFSYDLFASNCVTSWCCLFLFLPQHLNSPAWDVLYRFKCCLHLNSL